MKKKEIIRVQTPKIRKKVCRPGSVEESKKTYQRKPKHPKQDDLYNLLTNTFDWGL